MPQFQSMLSGLAYFSDASREHKYDLVRTLQGMISSVDWMGFCGLAARAAFWATIILTPFRYRFQLVERPVANIYADYTDFLIFGSDIALVATVVLWLIDKLIRREKFRIGPLFISLPLVALTVIAGIGSVGSIDPPLTVYHTARMALLTGLSFYVIDQGLKAVDIAIPVLIQVCIQAVVGIAQSLQQSDIGLQRLDEYLLNPEWAGVSVVAIGEQRWLRVYGLSDHPNILGGCLAFGLLVLLGRYVLKPGALRPVLASVIAMGSVALFLTFSRAAWLAYAVGVVFLMANFISGRRYSHLFRAMLPALGVSVLLLVPFLIGYGELVATRIPIPLGGSREVEIIEARSIAERAALNDAGIEVFVDHPILGAGVGTLPQAILERNPDAAYDYQPAHLTLIDAAAETGLLGVTIYAVLLAVPWLLFVLRADLQRSPEMLVVSSVLLAVTVVGFLDYYPWLLAPGRLWQYLIWGLWAAVYRSVNQGD